MDKEVANEVLRRVQKDQKMRNEAIKDKSLWNDDLDKDNTAYLKELVEREGWPTISDVGPEVAQAAWLLVQHSDHDPDFQSKCLKLMKDLPDNEVNPINVAYLEDRVRVAKGQSQLYGTQFYQDADSFGPRPIEGQDNLDDRRKAIGLEPFKDYESRMKELYSDQS